MKTGASPYASAILASFQFCQNYNYSSSSSDKLRRRGDRNKNHNKTPISTSTTKRDTMPPPSAHANGTHARHQSDAETKPASCSSSRSYHFWRKHRRAHTTTTSIPNISLSLAPISLPIQITTQPLVPPKRLHDRAPLDIERVDATEEVPIVFLSPIRSQTKRPAFPLTPIQTDRRPSIPTRSAPCTPWTLSPRTPPPNLSKALPILPLVAATAPYPAIGPAPRIPLPPTPQDPGKSKRDDSLRPSLSVRTEQVRRPLLHARSSSAPYLEVPFRLEPPSRSPLRQRSPSLASVMPLRQAPEIPIIAPGTPLRQAPSERALQRTTPPRLSLFPTTSTTPRRPSRPDLDDLQPPLKSPARTPLYPAALLSPRLPSLPFTPTNNTNNLVPSSPSTPVVMTGLLSEVLAIMNNIMSSQQSLASESHNQDQILAELTELVIIMQQEAEDLLTLADLVEEYVEEVELTDQVADIEDWASDLDLGYHSYSSEHSNPDSNSQSPVSPTRRGHSRDDSAVSLGAESAFHSGELRESIYKEVPITIIRSHTPDDRSIREVQIRGSTSLEPIILRPVAHTPVVQAPVPRKLAAKRSLSHFRDSGVSLFTSKSGKSDRGGVKSKKSEGRGLKWM